MKVMPQKNLEQIAKMGNRYANLEVVDFNREYCPLLLGIKIFAVRWFIYT